LLKLKGEKRGFDAKNEEGREWRGRKLVLTVPVLKDDAGD
jgi:hypothetical protein